MESISYICFLIRYILLQVYQFFHADCKEYDIQYWRLFGALFYTQNLYVPLYSIVINVHPERGYMPSRRPFNKVHIVSDNFRGL